ncbi:MAG: DUF5686 and carboxypeptidase regulatory-like domain-containing protein [bacterium]|nr:DUF5686 and carboxypeptidase regulatory-like domain-containing protein [bacterium]
MNSITSTLRTGIVLALFFLCALPAFSQSITGFVYDDENNPIPFAKVYLKDRGNSEGSSANSGAITDFEGKYFLGCGLGVHTLVFTAIGYDDLEVQVTVDDIDAPTVQNVFLQQTVKELNNIEVSTKRKNIGWMIVQNVIDNKKNMIRQLDGYTCDIYIKGVETFDKKAKKSSEDDLNNAPKDVFQEEEDEKEAKLKEVAKLNMIEVNVKKHFQYPRGVKEIRTGYDKIGNPEQIYYQSTLQGDFNFYESLIDMPDLHQGPILSPLHPSGILSYKYKLTDIEADENGDTTYVVKISARSIGNSTMEGDLYIKKNDWVLTKVDVSMHKGNLKIYDDFRVVQEFKQKDSLWLLSAQTFEYKTKYGKESVMGETKVIYANYVINPNFPPKFFSNEIGVTEKEAYERDSNYWDKIRPTPLTVEEQRTKFVQDSLQAIYTSEHYLDSIDSVFNKVTFLKAAFLGIGHMNRDKKTRWYFPSAVDLIEPIGIGGLRLGPSISFYKKFEDDQWISTGGKVTLGWNNLDPRGNIRLYHYYAPRRIGQYGISFSKSARMINANNAITSLLDRQNIYQNNGFRASHYIELVNGLYLYNSLRIDHRYQFDLDYRFVTWFDDSFQNTEPVQFDAFNAVRTLFYLSYVPAQKYRTEPTRKVVLGSAWPTFKIGWEKGWEGPLQSAVDFDYVYFQVEQAIQIRTMGESRYNIKMGSFVNQDSVTFIDRKFFRQGEGNRWLALAFIDPLNNFQNLDEAYETEDWYVQAHYIHHFNGAIINKIPFMKKTGIKSVAGAGFLYLPEYNNYFYTEAYIGVERIFKVFRERLRLGAYIIGSTSSNQFGSTSGDQPRNFKFAISMDIMSTDANEFNF